MHSTNLVLTTLSVSAFVGVSLMVLAQRLRIPAIVPLLLGGVLVGPEFLGVVQPEALGETLPALIMIAVSIILFEGGLTLDPSGYNRASTVIRRLLTAGVLITWVGAAAALHFLAGLPLSEAVLGGSLVIVTGPTVVTPLLRRIRLESRLDSILRWEGVLIDPVGVFVAVVVFEYHVSDDPSLMGSLLQFGLRFAVGFGGGVLGGLGLDALIRRRWLPPEFLNLFALTLGIFGFWVCETLASESGLLAVIAMGFVLAFKKTPGLKELTHFKQELTELCIAVLFILLAARLKLQSFSELGWGGFLAVAAVVFLIRPLNVLYATRGLNFGKREKLFLGWVAPRGIVAASMASIFAISLGEDAGILEAFTYAVIGITVILQGLSAEFLARLLKLQRPESNGWLIIGAHSFARQLAHFIEDVSETRVLLVDTNSASVDQAKSEGLTVIHENALDSELRDGGQAELVGNVLALTDNSPLNQLICQRWKESNKKLNTFFWSQGAEIENSSRSIGLAAFSELPPPSVVSHELEVGEARLMIRKPEDVRSGDNLPVMSAGPQQVELALAGELSPELLSHLYLYRAKVALRRLFSHQLVLRLEDADQKTVLEALLDRFSAAFPKLNRDKLLHDIQEREAAFPTGLGDGVVLPHAYVDDFDSSHCAVALVPGGVKDWPSPDGRPIQLVFLLVGPTDDPDRHLIVLSEVVHFLMEPGMIRRLGVCKSEAELLAILHETS